MKKFLMAGVAAAMMFTSASAKEERIWSNGTGLWWVKGVVNMKSGTGWCIAESLDDDEPTTYYVQLHSKENFKKPFLSIHNPEWDLEVGPKIDFEIKLSTSQYQAADYGRKFSGRGVASTKNFISAKLKDLSLLENAPGVDKAVLSGKGGIGTSNFPKKGAKHAKRYLETCVRKVKQKLN